MLYKTPYLVLIPVAERTGGMLSKKSDELQF